jgi:PEP-CTERM motif
MIWRFVPTAALISVMLTSLGAHAALLSRLGGQAYYDDVLDITWLADANLAATNTFGAFNIEPDGSMSWQTATTGIGFVAKMNDANYLGFNDWRVPSLSPIDGSAIFNQGFSNNAITDRGYAGSAGWVDGGGTPVSEMGYMYYVNLGNLGLYEPNGGGSPFSTNIQPGWGLANTGPFTNLVSDSWWNSVEVDSNQAWRSNFQNGGQRVGLKNNDYFVWPVRDGDVLAALEGDLNGDGFVGVDDLNIVLVNWNQNVTPGDLLAGDPTGEGFVGVDDLNIVLVNWNNGTPPGDSSNIPEPGTLAMTAIGLVCLVRRKRR